MSISPRKYHGPEVKCGGPGMCPDCTDKYKNIRDIFQVTDPEDLFKFSTCKYHVGIVLKKSEHNSKVKVCEQCKKEKIPGRDGIYEDDI